MGLSKAFAAAERRAVYRTKEICFLQQRITCKGCLGEKQCGGGRFRCDENACIPEMNVCDGHPDCANARDENEQMCCKLYSPHCNLVPSSDTSAGIFFFVSGQQRLFVLGTPLPVPLVTSAFTRLPNSSFLVSPVNPFPSTTELQSLTTGKPGLPCRSLNSSIISRLGWYFFERCCSNSWKT